MESDNIQQCFFGTHLSKAETALTEIVKCCQSEKKRFHELEEDLQTIIIERACVKEIDEDSTICESHESLLGKNFFT